MTHPNYNYVGHGQANRQNCRQQRAAKILVMDNQLMEAPKLVKISTELLAR